MSRMPAVPSRDDVEPDERAAYDHVLPRVSNPKDESVAAMKGLLVSPLCAAALREGGTATFKEYGSPNTWTPYLHEWFDLVVSAEAKNYVMQRLHTPQAVAVGIAPDTVKAVCDGRDDALSAGELEIVEFIRNCIYGTMTDESWETMKETVGSERGVVECAYFVLNLMIHIRLFQIFDVPGLSKEEHLELIERLRNGEGPVPDLDEYHERRLASA